MNERVIQAAAEAVDDARLTLTRAYAANDPEIKEIVKVAITAALRELAPDIRAAVERLVWADQDYIHALYDSKAAVDDARPVFDAARRALFTLLGVEDAE